MQDSPLLERYARRLNLTPEEARRRLFQECIPPRQRGIVRVHCLVRPRLYASDWRLVHEAGLATNMQGVMNALGRWQHCAPLVRSWGRELLHWRVSGRRLLAVARELFAAETAPAVAVAAARTTRMPITVPAALGHAREAVRQTFEVGASNWVRLHG